LQDYVRENGYELGDTVHLGVLEQGAGYGDALLFAAGQHDAALATLGVITLQRCGECDENATEIV
jgi:hypothetical protein